MKPYWADNLVYELFDEYIERCVLKNNSFLTDEKDVVTLNALDFKTGLHRYQLTG